MWVLRLNKLRITGQLITGAHRRLQEITEDGVMDKKHPVRGSFVALNTLLMRQVRGEWPDSLKRTGRSQVQKVQMIVILETKGILPAIIQASGEDGHSVKMQVFSSQYLHWFKLINDLLFARCLAGDQLLRLKQFGRPGQLSPGTFCGPLGACQRAWVRGKWTPPPEAHSAAERQKELPITLT